MKRKARGALVVVLGLTWPTAAGPALASGSKYEPAWLELKRMAGTWEILREVDETPRDRVSYHVTSGGSVVFEEFLGQEGEGVERMATAYHFDEDDLVATHYCGAGNQPRMRAVSWNAEKRTLQMDFWDVTHLPDPEAYYTTNIRLEFLDDENVLLSFRGREEGKLLDWSEKRLRRLSRRSYE